MSNPRRQGDLIASPLDSGSPVLIRRRWSQSPGRHRAGAATVLIDSAGKPFDLASLKGKVVLVSFVYTTCNGACPATTASLVADPEDPRAGQALGRLGRVRLDHARPEARHARGPEPLCAALRRRLGQLALPDRPAVRRSSRSSPPGGCGPRSARPACSTIPRGSFSLDPRGHQREIYNLEFLKADSVLAGRAGTARRLRKIAVRRMLLPTADCLLPTAYCLLLRSAKRLEGLAHRALHRDSGPWGRGPGTSRSRRPGRG